MGKRIRIGVDIGGAFTDLVAYDEETGEVVWKKVETTPKNPSNGVIESVLKSGVDIKEAYAFIHGQTLVINTILTRSGARVGLITTKGFRDVLEIQRSNRRDMYNFLYKKPEPFVPRYLRREVSERVSSAGEVLKKLDEEEVKSQLKYLIENGTESLAVSLINSYANPVHEKKIAEIAKGLGINIPISLSHEITQEWREYERTSTTVLNAYVKPIMKSYLFNLVEKLGELGFQGTAYAMLSNGGMATFDYVSEYPIVSVESGPVAGVIGAIKVAEYTGDKNIIAFDGGSTTAKASLVEGLMPKITTDYYVERDRWRAGYPIKTPVVETVEVGVGGTSIAWIDEVGNLKVGPKAAGSEPGPACYMKGGSEPTVTDAYVVTGIINPNYFLGGEMKLSLELAMKSMEKIKSHFNVSAYDAAEGIIKIANEIVANMMRLISVQRGYDPREFVLMAYGGSGPLFAPFVSKELDIKKVVIPVIPPGVFSAWGLLATDIRHDFVQTDVTPLLPQYAEKISSKFLELEDKIRAIFSSEGINSNSIVITRYADIRYYGQEHTVKVQLPPGIYDDKTIFSIKRRFDEAHKREYEYMLPETMAEIVNFHITGYAIVEKVSLKEVSDGGKSIEESYKGSRKVYLNGVFSDLPVYEKSLLPKGKTFQGPAVIEDPTSTILVLSNQSFSVDRFGNLIILNA